MKIYVNLGCGETIHPDWVNIDIIASQPGVISHDLRQGIPLLANSSDVVYHSHVLEHFRYHEAQLFLKECCRVLKPGGILRVAVPDLERICRLYIEKLEGALAGDEASGHDYDWMMLEMYDQSVREYNGGMLVEYLRQHPLPNQAFVYQRFGEAGCALPPKTVPNLVRRSWQIGFSGLMKRFCEWLDARYKRLWACWLLGPEAASALEIGRFRLSGEVHHWMYDRYSLMRSLQAVGFVNPEQKTATDSQIPDWNSFNLDTLADGTIRKPDSLFMEAKKRT
jgi:predicted SAM-dependent methyltransferase